MISKQVALTRAKYAPKVSHHRRPKRSSGCPYNLGQCVQHVLIRSEPVPDGTPVVRGHNFEAGRDLDSIMGTMLNSGFQATNLGEAVNVVNDMVCLPL